MGLVAKRCGNTSSKTSANTPSGFGWAVPVVFGGAAPPNMLENWEKNPEEELGSSVLSERVLHRMSYSCRRLASDKT